jgi:hypothetical protein
LRAVWRGKIVVQRAFVDKFVLMENHRNGYPKDVILHNIGIIGVDVRLKIDGIRRDGIANLSMHDRPLHGEHGPRSGCEKRASYPWRMKKQTPM